MTFASDCAEPSSPKSGDTHALAGTAIAGEETQAYADDASNFQLYNATIDPSNNTATDSDPLLAEPVFRNGFE